MWMSMPDSCLKCTKISVLALPQFLLYGYATFFYCFSSFLLLIFFILAPNTASYCWNSSFYFLAFPSFLVLDLLL